MDLGLRGKTAVVTGGSRGIGRSIALTLAAQGCDVAICARTQGPLEATRDELVEHGVRVHAALTDVTDAAELRRFIGDASETLGGPDILICSAGASFGGGIEDATDDDWVRTMDLNYHHCVRAVRAALALMKGRDGGAILLVASISGWKPVPVRAQYACAKAAVIQLAQSLALELAELRIRVNVISPGSILFEGGGWARFRDREPDAFNKYEREELPWQRLGRPEEVADVAAFLVSERARWINGANIRVDGAQRAPSAF